MLKCGNPQDSNLHSCGDIPATLLTAPQRLPGDFTTKVQVESRTVFSH